MLPFRLATFWYVVGLSGIPFKSLECFWLEIFDKNYFLVFETEQR